jgi:hypothetical protein
MKFSFLVGGAVGYLLGARAGRERYETIIRAARRVAGSQTVQATAGVLQGQLDALSHQAREVISGTLHAAGLSSAGASSRGMDGHRH